MIFCPKRLFRALAAAFAILAVEAGAETATSAGDLPVEGVIVDGGVVCPLLQTREGLQIALQGVARDRYPAGTQLKVEGRLVRNSMCMQGARTLLVNRILNAEYAR